jgi:solute carrier family 45 protein 1/2/4
MVVQPYLGICSDRCRSSWGRRRPFIAAGTLASIICLIGLALIPIAPVAIILIVGLNIAIQPVQGGLRALLAELCPRQQQPVVNGLAGVVVSVANVAGYVLQIVDLRPLVGFGSQFSDLCLLTTVAVGLPITLTCLVGKWDLHIPI